MYDAVLSSLKGTSTCAVINSVERLQLAATLPSSPHGGIPVVLALYSGIGLTSIGHVAAAMTARKILPRLHIWHEHAASEIAILYQVPDPHTELLMFMAGKHQRLWRGIIEIAPCSRMITTSEASIRTDYAKSFIEVFERHKRCIVAICDSDSIDAENPTTTHQFVLDEYSASPPQLS